MVNLGHEEQRKQKKFKVTQEMDREGSERRKNGGRDAAAGTLVLLVSFPDPIDSCVKKDSIG